MTARTSQECLRCRTRDPKDALHRMEHRRADRRRAAWRESKRRKAAAAAQPRPYGYLHSLACDGKHRGGRRGCIPIPVWTRLEDDAA